MGKPVEKKEAEIEQNRVVIGLLGALSSGKSTLAGVAAKAWPESNIVEEQYKDNPFLVNFYDDPQKYSFKSQLWFLEAKISQLATLGSSKVQVLDPALEMDYIYAKTHNDMGWMSNPEWELYKDMFASLCEEKKIVKPNLFIVAHAPVKVMMNRIPDRDRPYEGSIQDKYLRKLASAVDRWITEKSGDYEVLRVDTHDNNLLDQGVSASIAKKIGAWALQSIGATK